MQLMVRGGPGGLQADVELRADGLTHASPSPSLSTNTHTCPTGGGKHHSEMRYWHQAHWPLWGRAELAHRTDGFYVDLLQNATAAAAAQGYAGARWPKMTAAANHSGIDVPWLGMPYSSKSPFGLFTWESVNTCVGMTNELVGVVAT